MHAVLLSLLLSSSPGGDHHPGLSLKVPHSFPVGDAHGRLELLFDYWRNRFGMKAEWKGEEAFVEGRAMGIDFQAHLVLTPTSVDAELSDPGLLARSPALNYVRKKLLKYLHPTYQEP